MTSCRAVKEAWLTGVVVVSWEGERRRDPRRHQGLEEGRERQGAHDDDGRSEEADSQLVWTPHRAAAGLVGLVHNCSLSLSPLLLLLFQISWKEFVRWSGEPAVSPEQLLEEKLVKVFIKAQDMGHSLQVGSQRSYSIAVYSRGVAFTAAS